MWVAKAAVLLFSLWQVGWWVAAVSLWVVAVVVSPYGRWVGACLPLAGGSGGAPLPLKAAEVVAFASPWAMALASSKAGCGVASTPLGWRRLLSSAKQKWTMQGSNPRPLAWPQVTRGGNPTVAGLEPRTLGSTASALNN